MSLQSWDLIRTFLALHRAGSYEGAARLLKIDHSTIRRKIQGLEQEVGATLFVRRGGALVLAPNQETTLHAALQMEAYFGFFIQHTDMSKQAGTIRLSTLDIFASLLAPEMRRFQTVNPGIQLAITTEPHFVDLERETVDIAIRLARPLKGQDGLKKLGTLSFRVYGSPAYLAEPRDRGHNLLSLYAHFAKTDHEFSLADEKWHEHDGIGGTVVARSDSYPTLLRLCEEGLGLAMLPCLLADASPGLRTFGDTRTEVDIWALIRKDVAALPRMRLMVNSLAVAFRSMKASLTGTTAAPAPEPVGLRAATLPIPLRDKSTITGQFCKLTS